MKRNWIKSIYIGLIIISGILFFTYTIEKQSSKLPQLFKGQVEKEYIGIVSKKYIDQKNHNNKTLILDRSGVIMKTFWNADKSGFFEYVNESDSIVKNSGSEIINVYREGLHLKSFRMYWNIN
ncbi:hypothetical protein GCQ56_11810 [Marinifilum sp. N1E240]|uniref:hypothetical protein n=1 Tax=Marinifilum sp. N1E240 TaxID=2608082 RepID=UPI00128AF05C|nr:hypothetical protein [Marinifilum sp. N1E240]MPQ47689.1 hypothetical protein [Marinifilum sp. N1E240]